EADRRQRARRADLPAGLHLGHRSARGRADRGPDRGLSVRRARRRPEAQVAMARLDDRVVLITGAARGIGAATARRLAADGARLALADLDKAGVEKLAAELKGLAIQADVTRAVDIARMVEETQRRFGRIDVLFNNAG